MSISQPNHLIIYLATINQATIKKSGKGVIDVTLLTFTRRNWDRTHACLRTPEYIEYQFTSVTAEENVSYILEFRTDRRFRNSFLNIDW